MKQFLITFSITVLTIVVGTMLTLSIWGWQAILDTPEASIEPTPAVPIATVTPNIAATAQAHHLAQDEQILTLQTTVQARDAAYKTQIAEANRQISTYQNAIENEQEALTKLTTSIQQLEQALLERQQRYPEQLQTALNEVQSCRTELIKQRNAMQANLSDIQNQ